MPRTNFLEMIILLPSNKHVILKAAKVFLICIWCWERLSQSIHETLWLDSWGNTKRHCGKQKHGTKSVQNWGEVDTNIKSIALMHEMFQNISARWSMDGSHSSWSKDMGPQPKALLRGSQKVEHWLVSSRKRGNVKMLCCLEDSWHICAWHQRVKASHIPHLLSSASITPHQKLQRISLYRSWTVWFVTSKDSELDTVAHRYEPHLRRSSSLLTPKLGN